MKILFSIIAFHPFLISASKGATAYWAFQNQTAVTGSTFQGTVNSNSGFSSDPTIAKTNGAAVSANGGGQTSFFDPNNPSVEYLGSGGGVGEGNSFGWNVAANATESFTGAGFTITVNTVGLIDLKVAFSLRAAGSSTAGAIPLSFKSIQYSVGSTGVWSDTGATSPTWTVGSGFVGKSVNFSALDEIEGLAEVHLRFIFNDSNTIATGGTASSIRIDNLVIEAIPEPGIGLMALLPTLALVGRRRRK